MRTKTWVPAAPWFVVDPNHMGTFNPASNAIYQELPSALGQVFSSPAWFNGKLYYGAVGDTLKAFNFSSGLFVTSPAQSANTFGYPGTTPSISANGSMNGLVWAAENSAPATLHAYFGDGNKFISPPSPTAESMSVPPTVSVSLDR